MKSALIVLALVMSASAQAKEVKKCWFSEENGDRKGLRCRAVLVENDNLTATDRERVQLFVDCNNGFDLSDRRAVQFDKGDNEYNLGTERNKLALLILEERHTALDGRDQDASLIISKKDGRGRESSAERLEGKCEKAHD